MIGLTKKQDALIKSLYSRHGRKKHNLCVCEGVRCCAELFAARPNLVELIVRAESFNADIATPQDVITLPDKEFSRLSSTVTSQGIITVAVKPADDLHTEPQDDFLLALDRIADPGNFGTILRTARAAGLTELWFTAGSADPFGDKTIRAALAAQFTMKMRCFPDLKTMSAAAFNFGYRHFYLTDPHQGENCFSATKLFDKSVVVIGSEAHGVNELPGAQRVTIPMPGKFESLNAAQAATIFIFEYVRRNFS